jgi:hypothetical protein
MIKLISLLKEVLLEGGNVFKDTEYDTTDINQADIEQTVNKFVEALSNLFPGKKQSFQDLKNKENWLGSTGRKQVANKQDQIVSGDIDLAYSKDAILTNGKVDYKGWGMSKEDYENMHTAVASRAKTATEEQIKVTALLRLIVPQIEAETSKTGLHVTGKATSSGVLHFSFPQYSKDGKKLDTRAQIDLDIGDLNWLTFRNNADISKEEEEKGIKRLHRGQLMLAMFATAGYTFKAGVGLVDTATKKQRLGNTPEEAIEEFNRNYKPTQPLTRAILSNYNDLVKYVEENMKGEDYNETMGRYYKELQRASAYIPDHVTEWLNNQEKI